MFLCPQSREHGFRYSGKWLCRLTIRVLLVRIGHESAVVPVIRNAVIVIIVVTGISLAVFVVVSLVGVGHIGTVVQVVLVAIFINILIVVTGIPNAVRVRVKLKERNGG